MFLCLSYFIEKDLLIDAIFLITENTYAPIKVNVIALKGALHSFI